jgi:hypothetical protein
MLDGSGKNVGVREGAEIEVREGTGVSVGITVFVEVGVAVEVWVGVAVKVGVAVGTRVGVAVAVGLGASAMLKALGIVTTPRTVMKHTHTRAMPTTRTIRLLFARRGIGEGGGGGRVIGAGAGIRAASDCGGAGMRSTSVDEADAELRDRS